MRYATVWKFKFHQSLMLKFPGPQCVTSRREWKLSKKGLLVTRWKNSSPPFFFFFPIHEVNDFGLRCTDAVALMCYLITPKTTLWVIYKPLRQNQSMFRFYEVHITSGVLLQWWEVSIESTANESISNSPLTGVSVQNGIWYGHNNGFWNCTFKSGHII